jgi:hypothetical protein
MLRLKRSSNSKIEGLENKGIQYLNISNFLYFITKEFHHENSKFRKHEVMSFFRAFACPVKPAFLFNQGVFVIKIYFMVTR